MDDRGILAARQLGLLPGQRIDPLSDEFIEFLTSQTKENSQWDFKRTIATARDSDFPTIAKHIFAFSNYGGGYILIGWEERPSGGFQPVGLPDDFHLDQAELQQKFNSFSNYPITLGYVEYERVVGDVKKRFAAIYVPPSQMILQPVKDGSYTDHKGKTRKSFRVNDILWRRGTQSITATDNEVRLIERRIKVDGYQIAIVSGQPDSLEETLWSNLFHVSKLPPGIYCALKRKNEVPAKVALKNAFIPYEDRLCSFDDPVRTELSEYIDPKSVEFIEMAKWRSDLDSDTPLTWLLKNTLVAAATRKGMFIDRHDRLFYPMQEGEHERRVYWRGLIRGDSRKVAFRMYAQQFDQEIVVHDAIQLSFDCIDNENYLVLVPGFVLTWNGRSIITDSQVGSVVTSLLSDKYNSSVLRDIFFWIEQLQDESGRLQFLGGKLQISSRSIEAKVSMGISSDQFASVDQLIQGRETPTRSEGGVE